MLNSIQIANFKSYQEQTLPLAPLTLLIGANASGKSNLIEAFRFLSWLAQGQKLSSLKYAINDSEKFIRGNINELFYPEQTAFTLGAHIQHEQWQKFTISICLRDNELRIQQEMILDEKNTKLYEIKQAATGLSDAITIAYNNFKRGKNKPQIYGTDQISLINQLSSPASFDKNDKESQKIIPKLTHYFQEILTNTLFLDPVPSKMRQNSIPDRTLTTDGANLAGVLFQLWDTQEHRTDILEFIQSLPEQNIQDILFTQDKRGQVDFELKESFHHTHSSWSAELLSDGTLRVLAIAAALLSANEGSTVIIEEIDNGIHPSRAKQLMQSIIKQAKKRNLRLLLSTHNPALMNALPNEALGDVVFCYRDQEQGDSRLVKLSDLPRYPELLVQGSLGDLVTQGVLDQFVKSPVSEEERKQKALAWLNKMMGNNHE